MQFLRRLPAQVWHLFVDDGPVVAILLAWIALACVVLSRVGIGIWSGPVLFAGIAVITFLSFRLRP